MQWRLNRWLPWIFLVVVSPLMNAQYLGLSSALLDQVRKEYGDEAVARLMAWQDLMIHANRQPDLNDLAKMLLANNFFNRIPWVTDSAHWGKEDYWATPVEMLSTHGGDCEDYSIAKYFTLKDIGVLSERLRITYVKALELNQAHMVLAYYPSPGAEPLILDNINKTILPASKRPDLLPIYSFNGESLWLARSRGRELKADSQTSLPQWRELNQRLLREIGAGD